MNIKTTNEMDRYIFIKTAELKGSDYLHCLPKALPWSNPGVTAGIFLEKVFHQTLPRASGHPS